MTLVADLVEEVQPFNWRGRLILAASLSRSQV